MLLRIWLTIGFLIFALPSWSQSTSDSLEPVRYYYENGQVSSEGSLRNGQPDGYWKSYYRDGTLKAEGNRKDFQLDSLWIFYNRDGLKTVSIEYKAGQKEGLRKTFDEQERLIKRERFRADLASGFTDLLYPEGQLKKQIPFVEGKEEGQGFEYAKDGRIITLLDYKGGRLARKQNINRFDQQGQKSGLWVTFHKNGNIESEGPYLNDLKNGYWKFYRFNGDLLRVEKWVNGELQEGAAEVAKVELKKEINPKTGKLSFKGAFQNGKPTGVHRRYNDEGEVISAEIYDQGIKLFEGIVDEEGRKQGPWKVFYRDGNLRAEGAYQDNLKVGTWKYYYRDGKLEQTGNYIAGKPNGTWNWYFPTGDLLREEEYLNGLEDGLSIEYSDSGTVIAQGEYIDGFKEGAWFFMVNDHREEGSFFEGQRNGNWKHFYLSNDQLAFEGSYENGQENGYHVHYYANGNVKRRGEYVAGIKEGIWEYFDEAGNLRVKIEYENGEEVRYNGKKIDYGRRYEKALAEEKAQKALQAED